MAHNKRNPDEYRKALMEVMPMANQAAIEFGSQRGPLDWANYVVYQAKKLLEAIDKEIDEYINQDIKDIK